MGRQGRRGGDSIFKPTHLPTHLDRAFCSCLTWRFSSPNPFNHLLPLCACLPACLPHSCTRALVSSAPPRKGTPRTCVAVSAGALSSRGTGTLRPRGKAGREKRACRIARTDEWTGHQLSLVCFPLLLSKKSIGAGRRNGSGIPLPCIPPSDFNLPMPDPAAPNEPKKKGDR